MNNLKSEKESRNKGFPIKETSIEERLCNLGEMVLEDMSWHLRYYEYSYMYYIVGSAVLCLTYTIIYCVKMPVNKIKNLKDVIDYDPQGPDSIE